MKNEFDDIVVSKYVSIYNIGKIIKKNSKSIWIRWLNGRTDKMPSFEDCAVGQYFEVLAEYVSNTSELHKVIHVKALPNFHIHTKQEAIAFFNSLPTSHDLPETTF